MKKFIVTIFALIMTLLFCACASNGKSENSVSNSNVLSSEDKTSSLTQETKSEQSNSGRDLLMTYQVEINGNSLTLPFEYSQLKDLGYTLPEDEDLKPNTYTIGSYVKNADGDSLHVQFWNGSNESKKYSECQVCQIEITLKQNFDVELPGGIKFDKNLTPEQVIEVYGEADYDNDQADYRALTYEDGGFEQVKFMFYKEDNMKDSTVLTINHIED